MRFVHALIVLALAAPLAAAEEAPLKVEIAPSRIEEGKAAALEVRLTNSGKTPLALGSVTLALGPQEWTRALGRKHRGTSLGPVAPGVVTVELHASEGDLGPIARAPRPPLVEGLGGEGFTTLRVLEAGKTLAVGFDVAALAGSELALRVAAQPLGDLAVFVPQGEESFVRSNDAATGGFPGPASVEVRFRRWVPPRLDGAAGEVLVAESAAVPTTTLKPALEVIAAAFSSKEALAKAGFEARDARAAVLLEGAWVFEFPAASSYVPREGEVVVNPGHLAPLAARLASGEAAAVGLHSAGDAVAKDLAAAGLLSPAEGKMGGRAQLRAADLGRFLGIVRKHGLAVDGLELRTPERKAPVALPPGDQGQPIPCLDCKVLRPGRADCPACGGRGTRFQPARMADEELQRSFGKKRREKVDAAPRELRELRGALTDLLVYGKAFAAGWRDVPVPTDEVVAGALVDAVRAELRLRILELEGK